MSTTTLNITSLAAGGDGIGRLEDGRVAFVSGALPGDVVALSSVSDKGRYVRAAVGELICPSEQRIAPACELAACAGCGGCPWAALAYEAQLFWKRQIVVDALARIARLGNETAEELVAPCLPSKHLWHYRNKVEFEVGTDQRGRLALGMHEAGGGFVPLTSCKLSATQLKDAPKALAGALRYAQGTRDLGILRVGIRHSVRTKSTQVALWTGTGRFPRAHVARILRDSLPTRDLGISRVLIKGSAEKRIVAGVETLAGRGFWVEHLGDFSYALSAPSFFQVNTPGAEALQTLVLDALGADGLDRVLDLYAGAGTFTLPLAAAAREVAAVEMEGSSVRDLRRNLEFNALDARVIGGDVARELASLHAADKVVVDPPRSGLGKRVVTGLLDMRPRAIAYVSCNPATLARDIAALCSGGYRLRSATPVDLFAQTPHVECVAVLERA